MSFNKRLVLEGKHAFLGASKGAWVNYTEDKLREAYFRSKAKQRGTELHDLAHRLITLGQKLGDTGQTLNMYVNDVIGYKLKSEEILYYSMNCFGTADAIGFRNGCLYVFDLKTGIKQASFDQLKIYVALYCLEQDINPNDIEIELRIYQNDDIFKLDPLRDEILYIMSKIKSFDKILDELKEESDNV